MQMWPIGLRRDGVSEEVCLGYCAIDEYSLDLKISSIERLLDQRCCRRRSVRQPKNNMLIR